jgi:signal transduction histidine kinase
MRSHLYWQVYRGLVGVALLCIVVFASIAWFRADWVRQPPEVVGAVEVVLDTLPPPEDPAFQATIARLADKLDADITIEDADGRKLAVVGAVVPWDDRRWDRRHGRSIARVALGDGRRVTFSHRHPEGVPRHLLGVLAVLGATLALGALPLARRITRRLEHVREAVDGWGPGALDVRAPVEGADEVASVATAFNEAADRVTRLLEAQRRMLSSTSHELRSPLARIRLALELLDDGDAEREALIADAVGDVEELDRTVGELLDVGRLQAVGVDAPTDVDLYDVATEIGGRLGVRVEGASHVVKGEPRLLRRLVRNLVDNALPHGGGDVTVRVADGALEVADRGPGIPVEEAERVWEPFHRPAGHAEGRDGGVGLGLWLVAEIARAHGAVATHEPRPDGGTRFRVAFGVG